MSALTIRRVLALVVALSLVAVYLIWWVSYAGIHENTRYRMSSPGAVFRCKGLALRLEGLTGAGLLTGAKGEAPAAPARGATWVVARFQVVEQDRNNLCNVDFLLVSSTGTSWKAASHPGILRALDVPGLGAKAPYVAEEIYEVPTSAATQLVGIAVEDQTTPARTPVLRPLG